MIGPIDRSREGRGIQVLEDGRVLVGGSTNGHQQSSKMVLLGEDGTPGERFGVGGLFFQADESTPIERVINPVRRNVSLRGDHLYVFGVIAAGPANPSTGARNRAFGVAKYVMPLMLDGFDG